MKLIKPVRISPLFGWGLILIFLSGLIGCQSRGAEGDSEAAAIILPTIAPSLDLPTPTPPPTATIPPPTATPPPTLTPLPTPRPTETPVVVLATPFPTPFAPDGFTNVRLQKFGHSWWGHDLEAYEIGNGEVDVVIVGGIHGGYEWNTILLAYEFLDEFDARPELVPDHVTLTIIPVANPDGQLKIVGTTARFESEVVGENTISGRTNGNEVDLNRNWGCNWETVGQWRDQTISGGATPFSEVESAFLRDFILEKSPAVVIFLHSAFPGVFPGRCNVDHEPSIEFGRLYAQAAGYPFFEGGFTAYPVTGDATDYLAGQGIPSFSVELNNHFALDYRQNLTAVQVVFEAIPEP